MSPLHNLAQTIGVVKAPVASLILNQQFKSGGNRLKTRSAEEIWEAALGELQIQVSRANYDTWLKDTVGISYNDNQFVVGVPSAFSTEWLEKRWHSLIEKTLINITGHGLEVNFCVHKGEHPSPTTPPSTGAAADSESIQQLPLPQSNQKYTFDTFIIGNCNRLAYAAALGVAQKPGHSYNPLFLYGGVGIGKTHLLHAIGHTALENKSRVLYVSAEQFTSDFISAIQERKTKEFRQRYRNVDMLLIDDIQFISGKEQTQESFFHIFNYLHNADRQIAITSDRPPMAMPLLEDRLRSRFEWGLIADIQPPDFETRLAILQAKAKKQGASIPYEVLEFLSRRLQQNIRELEGALNRVIAFARLTRAELTIKIAAQALDNIATTKHPAITPDSVVETVARFFDLAPQALRSKKRDQHTALARQIAMYLIREEAHRSLAEIGRELGGRDHSTVIHNCEKIAQEINVKAPLRQQILEIRKMLYPREI